MFSRVFLVSILFFSIGILSAQKYEVGDTVQNFTLPICVNDDGDFQLNQYNGAVNGKENSVILFIFFASW